MSDKRTEQDAGAPRLEVVAGPDKGLVFALPEGVATVGRAGNSTLALKDPLLSRQHCQFSRNGAKVEVADLDSANGTIVNGVEVPSATLKNGDEILLGDTRLIFRAGGSAAEAPLVDLGFDSPEDVASDSATRPNWRPLIWAIAAVAVVAIAASFILRGGSAPTEPKIVAPVEAPVLPLVVRYEKVEANDSNIFRYGMELSPSRMLSIEIDDLSEDRHVRKSAEVPVENVERLARRLEKAGMFALESPSQGISPDGSLMRRSVSVASGKRFGEAVVENRVVPPAISDVCDLLETFGRNELGIWAVQYPTEKLIELARESFTRARNLFEQRDISHGNLYDSVKACRESIFYLETVEPKPDFNVEMLNLLEDAEAELSRRYEEQRFRADRAINLKEWQTAAEELRILREQIPDEDDPRNADATRKLLDVENRIRKGKGK